LTSVNNGSVVTVSTDTDFIAANSTHADALTDGQYLVIGNDGGATTATQTTELEGAYTNRVTREWRVENTGSVETVNLKFDGFDDSYVLLTDTDGDFSSGATNAGSLSTSGTITLTLNDGDCFTLVQQISERPFMRHFKYFLNGVLQKTYGEN
jgi:hypothetical protein